ncbi:hypothetical protein [Leptospira bandrabouensis]|uniref:hypothetical protein n=1 Tax=Leptospira bandrabouensis TaxID=2484903 RepID=UPI001EEC5D81|nr:hypothetical protein [Leptospira bandrabouensis]MCG6154032.1 hypothetical protein [Leptospira bandrabouensis]
MQKIAIEYFGFEACIHKRRDFIDNSFHSTLSEARTLEYFSNSNINPGIYKMAINGFENSLFTYNISKEMLFLVWIKTLFFGILFLSFGLFGYENVLILIFQISLPLILLQNAIKHSLFVSRSKTIFNDYRKLFYDFKMDIDKTKKYPEILTILLDYETAISAANILLSDKVYNKLNRNLSDLWEKMKIEYNISS